jgi:hypothetical protein
MSIWHREAEIRLDLLTSLSRSQKALAVMLEHLAVMSGETEPSSEGMALQLASMVRFQQQLARRITASPIHEIKSGIPMNPWLNRELGVRPSLYL